MNACSRAAALAAGLLLPALAGTQPAVLAPFTAHYVIQHGKTRIGESTFTLRTVDSGYAYESRTQPKGIARLLAGTVTESSRFVVDDRGLRPLRFSARESRGKQTQQVDFDWAGGLAHSERNGERVVLELKGRVLDHSLIQIALMLDLPAQGAIGPYTIVEKNALRTYLYERAGEETVATPAGSFRSVKVRQRRAGSQRELILWCAPELAYLAVLVEQRKEGKTVLRMSLTAVEGLGGAD